MTSPSAAISPPSSATDPGADTRITCDANDGFAAWLAASGGSIAISTYQAGKVAMLGWDGRQITLLMRDFEKPLGMAYDRGRLALATRHAVWMFANAPLLAPDYLEEQPGRYDALYLPRVAYHTGDLHLHDLVWHGDALLAINTRFCCLSGLSKDYSFVPLWRPKFLTDLAPEDRCHLNGLAIRDGKPKYVTALGQTDTPGGWRENKASGGVVIDIETHEVVASGLSMPHSPRWHDGRLWVLNSGAGELLTIDPETKKAQVVCGLPGYLRGLCLVGPYALVGMSLIREQHIFGGLPIQQKLSRLHCGVAIVDTRSGAQIGFFEFTSGCSELYDTVFLPGQRRPMILSVDKPAVREAFTNPESSYWLRPSRLVADDPLAPPRGEGKD